MLQSGANAAVMPTSSVSGSTAIIFLSHMLTLLDGPGKARIVADQVARPTCAGGPALGVTRVAEQLLEGDPNAQGLFHTLEPTTPVGRRWPS